MNCEGTKCKNKIYMESICNLNCNKKFCCKNCLFEHQIECHKSELSKKSSSDLNKKQTKTTIPQSIYIKPGQLIREFKTDPKFDKANFEFVKMGMGLFNIGSGAFGDVFLAKNIVDSKYYAIKKVLY